MKSVVGLGAGAICAAILAACAGGITPYENLSGQQVRGLPKEEPAPPLPDVPPAEKPLADAAMTTNTG